MALNSFFGLLTLQVGAAILAAVFFVISIIVLIVNVFDYENHPENDWPMNLMLVIIFAIMMVVAGALMFFAAYNESRTSCLNAIILIVIILAFWLVLTIFSLVNNPRDLKKVCVKTRCGESFWLVNLQYRGGDNGYWNWERDKPKLPPPVTEVSLSLKYMMLHKTLQVEEPKYYEKIEDEKSEASNKHPDFQFLNSNVSDGTQTENGENHSLREGSEVKHLSQNNSFDYKFGLGMVGAILICVANLLFFLFTIMIMYGYMQELQHPYYYE